MADLFILSCFSASGAGQGSIDNRIEQAMVSGRRRIKRKRRRRRRRFLRRKRKRKRRRRG